MVGFIKENSYSMVKMFVNQIGMTVFGTMLALATAKNDTLLLVSSIFSILFYLFLLYTMSWELGAKDKIRVDGGRLKAAPSKGLFIAIGGNVPNLLLALLMGLGAIISQSTGAEWAANMSFVCNAIARLIEGMYLGVIKILEGVLESMTGVNPGIIDVWWWFIIITLPAMLAGWLGYALGLKNIRILSIFGIKSPDEGKAKNHSHSGGQH